MTVLTDIRRQLVQRRLWPVAIVLVAALAAVPVLLAKNPTATPAPAVPTVKADDGGELASAPLVSLASEEGTKRRRVLGSRKDPFAFKAESPDPAPGTTTTTTGTTPTSVQPTGNTGTVGAAKPSTPTGGASGPLGAGGLPVAGVTPGGPVTGGPVADPKPSYPLYTLTVRFGDSSSSDLQRMHVKRLTALPDDVEPVAVYLGVSDDRKRAVFLVDTNVLPQGDGACNPHPASCETVELGEGETEFFDVVDPETGQVTKSFQLDLVDIKTKRTASASAARTQRARESAEGRRALMAHIAESGPIPFRYDAGTGTVHEVVVDGEAATAQSGS